MFFENKGDIFLFQCKSLLAQFQGHSRLISIFGPWLHQLGNFSDTLYKNHNILQSNFINSPWSSDKNGPRCKLPGFFLLNQVNSYTYLHRIQNLLKLKLLLFLKWASLLSNKGSLNGTKCQKNHKQRSQNLRSNLQIYPLIPFLKWNWIVLNNL